MALNPPLNQIGEPYRVEGECFILQRKGIEFQVKVEGMGKMSGKGTLVLTTNRIVLINSKNLAKSDLKAFDIPLALTYKEKFNQPIFGANYLSGMCKPLFNQLPGDCEFKIWFMEGGCGKFLKCFRFTIGKIRENKGHASQQFINEIQSSQFQSEFAYFDPNDPSTIYISQPPVGQQQYPPPQQQQNHQEEQKVNQNQPHIGGAGGSRGMAFVQAANYHDQVQDQQQQQWVDQQNMHYPQQQNQFIQQQQQQQQQPYNYQYYNPNQQQQ